SPRPRPGFPPRHPAPPLHHNREGPERRRWGAGAYPNTAARHCVQPAFCCNREDKMAGLYYEDFEIGREFHHDLSRTVTDYDNISFSLMTMNTQPLHIDHHFAEQTEWGKPLFNSL